MEMYEDKIAISQQKLKPPLNWEIQVQRVNWLQSNSRALFYGTTTSSTFWEYPRDLRKQTSPLSGILFAHVNIRILQKDP